ncbi:reverse transcriptase domain-containing protein [Tanacetum coccineum]
MNEAERNYAPMEKLALSLIHMTRRLRRYFEVHPVKVITHQPIKQILSKTEAVGKLAKSVVELGAYNITFEPRNAVKGQVLADFIAETPDGEAAESYFQTPEVVLEMDEYLEIEQLFIRDWQLYWNYGSGRVTRNGREIYEFQSGVTPVRLQTAYTNRGVQSSTASSDSMIKYLAKAREYIACFKSLSIENIPRNLNQKADVLNKLASVAFNHFTKEILVEILNERSTEEKEINAVVKEEGDNWMTPIIQCLAKGIWLNKARNLRVKINQYVMEDGVLLKKSYLVPMLRCVGPLQANYVIREIHMGACRMHSGPRAVVRKVMRHGYYWPTLHEDAKKEIQKCDSCQIHSSVWTALDNRQRQRWNGSRLDLERIELNGWMNYQMSYGPTEQTPFSLTYGSEEVIPAEIGIPTYQTMMIRDGFNAEELRLNLDLLQALSQGNSCFEGTKKVGLKTKGSWDPNGKDHTESRKHIRMALTSCKP